MADEEITPTEEALAFDEDAGDAGLGLDTAADDSLSEDPVSDYLRLCLTRLMQEYSWINVGKGGLLVDRVLPWAKAQS